MKRFSSLLFVSLLFLLSYSCFIGCGHDGADLFPELNGSVYDRLTFPEGFLFGAATAGFQSDMGCPTLPASECVDARSDWYQFVTSPDMINRWYTFLSGEDPSRVGPGHWELYETDMDLAAQECNHNAFRMSIEWSRIFPFSTIGIHEHEKLRSIADQQALNHYHEVFSAMKDRGLEPLVTLHHYTMPTWIHDGVGCTLDLENCSPHGWIDRDTTVREIAKYAGFVAREFGSEVDLWGTLNEPFAVLLSGYLMPTPMRTNPPVAILKAREFKTAYNAMIDAHARMYDAVKEQDTGDADGDGLTSQVGVIYAIAPVDPLDPKRELDRQAAENVFYLWNTAYLDAVSLGRYDEHLDGNTVYREDLTGRMDYLGMNYKVRIAVQGIPCSLLPPLSPLANFNPLTLKMDEVYPRGIYEMALLFHDRYGVPILITENNGQSVPKGDVETEKQYVVENLSWLSHAIKKGVDIRGYFYWSLTDNIEWNHGMTVPLGLYRVNSEDPQKQRVPRETVDVFGAIAAAGAIPRDLEERYPVDFDPLTP